MSEHPGLPDLQSLAAMATELFQALPTAALPLVSGLQPAIPAAPIGSVQPSVSGANPQRPPLGRTSETPTLTSPGLDQHLAASPAPNYYFADNASHYPLANLQLDQLTGQASPKDFGLPDENDLRELLATELSVSKFDAPAGSASPAPDSRFYFLDSHAQPILGNKVFGNDPKHGHFAAEHSGFDVHAIRRDFPILSERVNGKPLVWFDNAATTHKPRSVIERVSYFYEHENSNIHRAAHELAARATDAYEGARNKVAGFLGAKTPDEIIFVRGATEGINLLANTFGQQQVGEGDEIIVSQLEHHANIVPWHMLANRVGAKLRVIPVDDTGQILLDEFRKLINGRTKLVSVTQVSNALGTVTPVKDIIDIAHANGVPVIVDGAQSVSHMRVDVQALDADFFVFSGHKVFGPTGIGVVYGKTEHLQKMSPWQGGGNMIADVTFERIIYQDPPNRFEAGTGNIADAVGLGAAIDYVQRIGMDRIARYEHDLLAYGTQRLQTIPGVRLVGTAANKASVLSFVLAGYKTEEVGTELNREGIAVRSGHHCAQPILRRFGLETTVRPSFAFYNTCEEIDLLASVVERLARRSR
ncbi:family 2A encapsulin nanocompartment cargo protein cysteine desulfurase [Cellvibrio sp. PSBB023]|uniref:family 2A encapsulin nanocompartment cargo protein cysteine desulfurase n=1 Tax=Cellvibrio sp. PSBB023 TaxID=1945512 RepID=UPI00098EE447|nr:family 2A encapsulin nanocompartment cargo protein cysteine desulfurase [Cellvibrio sp. PSBB023]AQT59618.1 cysteine desulfurase [Cellvibrio sp. PSBB023]